MFLAITLGLLSYSQKSHLATYSALLSDRRSRQGRMLPFDGDLGPYGRACCGSNDCHSAPQAARWRRFISQCRAAHESARISATISGAITIAVTTWVSAWL